MTRPKKLLEGTVYDVHALLDYLLVECAVSNVSMAKKFSIPYKNVFVGEPDVALTEFEGAKLIVEIAVKWDATNVGEAKDERTVTIKPSIKSSH